MTLRISILLSLFVAATLQVYVQLLELPPVMASHFDMNGVPDEWMNRGSLILNYAIWLIFPTGILSFSPLLVKALPVRLVSLPNKGYWMTPDNEEKAIKKLFMVMLEESSAIALFLVVSFQLILEANLKESSFNTRVFITMLTLFVAFTVLWVIRVFIAFRIPPGHRELT